MSEIIWHTQCNYIFSVFPEKKTIICEELVQFGGSVIYEKN